MARNAPPWLERSAPLLLATAAFVLAFFSPIEHVDSDPAIALLASQALLDHRTLRLDAYAGDPACAYDFGADYRIVRRGGSYVYYSHGVPVLSLPWVWLANRAGYHMLDQGDEQALQNLLSALCCALLAVLLWRLCRVELGPGASLAVAAVSLFGSSLASTLATGLWNAAYEILLLALGLLHLSRRQAAGFRPSYAYLALLAALAFLCRPTAAFAALAAALTLTPLTALRKRGVVVLLVLTALGALAFLGAVEWLPRYYSPLKLTPRTPLPYGLDGVLLSPSRGLLAFSPFLIPVAAVALRFLPALWSHRLFRLAAVWTALQVLAVATRGNWWGGHSYGPRLLAEVMLPAVLVTCLAWRELERWATRWRFAAAAAYLLLGLGAVWIHSWQGLFNPHAVRWNFTPDVDRAPELVFDWRYPQFLASESSLEERLLELQRRRLDTYALGGAIPFDGAGALFRGWYPPESGWRWSRGTSAEIVLRLGELPAPELYLLELTAGALGRQQIALEVNGAEVGRLEIAGHAARARAFAFERGLLKPFAENRFRFALPGATGTREDPRQMGLALYALELRPLPADFAGVGYAEEPFFARGWSGAEGGWRWTDGRTAVIDYPVADAAGLDTLVLEAGALGDQRVTLALNGVEIGALAYRGFAAAAGRLVFDPALLEPRRMNRIELTLPEARTTAGDDRLLGLAFVRLELRRGDL